MDDDAVVAAQLDRPLRSPIEVLVRCHLGLPVVVSVPPLLDDGTPFPTSYWLTCPLAVRRIGRVEGEGGVRAAETMIRDDPGVAAAYRGAMDRYRDDRELRIPHDHAGPVPGGGIGGSKGGVKCLHAHYADTAAGNANPVGAWVAPRVEPLDCVAPCTLAIDGGMRRNPDWVEPGHAPQ